MPSYHPRGVHAGDDAADEGVGVEVGGQEGHGNAGHLHAVAEHLHDDDEEAPPDSRPARPQSPSRDHHSLLPLLECCPICFEQA